MRKQPQEETLFRAVEELLAGGPAFPEPAERARLREAAGVTQAALARALETTPQTVKNWEAGRSEPRPPRRGPYLALLEGWAKKHPAPREEHPATPPAQTPAAVQTPAPAQAGDPEQAGEPAPAATPPGPAPARPAPAPKRPAARKTAARPATPPGNGPFAHGPLAVLTVEDGALVGHAAGGLVLDVPATTLPALVEWTLAHGRLGAPRLDGSGRDADPLLVLTPSALERFGLPAEPTEDERDTGRLAPHHPVIGELETAGWKLTRRGFGPWARIYRPAQGSRRLCVQLCIPSWHALDPRSWKNAATLQPAHLARVMSLYASRVMTPRGSTAVTGLELMTALHPPTRASAPDADGIRHSVHNPGSLGTAPIDPPPCEAVNGHPVLAHLPRFHERTPAERLFEEAYDWSRPLTDEDRLHTHLVGIDVNMAFAAAANGALVGLATAPVHTVGPVFDPKVPGSWLVDLSHVDPDRVMVGNTWVDLCGDLLPSPFTPTGERPEGPAWYATPTVAYATELGYRVEPLEAWLRPDSGRYLDAWYKRLRDAYMATMADLGVPDGLPPEDFLAAMDGHKERDPDAAIVLDAVKGTVKFGLGKLQQKAAGGGWTPGQPWPALSRPTWRPDIRATVISRARVGMHRKMTALAAATGRYPVSVLSDCAVYAANGPSPLDVLPYTGGRTIPGSFRIGASPGMVKHEGTQPLPWAERLRAHTRNPLLNLARTIRTGAASGPDTGE
ncbi:telomere-associated protein Tap [Streptomyces griseus]|uniref:telomere-associated protein Tap n=1 Tax=Streptomyces griseus TaxID=1911 RepID=UPI0004C9C47F|nr:helix-turn-helix domain-containing protein [Streptomyces griseus]